MKRKKKASGKGAKEVPDNEAVSHSESEPVTASLH